MIRMAFAGIHIRAISSRGDPVLGLRAEVANNVHYNLDDQQGDITPAFEPLRNLVQD